MRKCTSLRLAVLGVMSASLLAAGLGVGSSVPDFTVKDYDGRDVRFSELKGDVTVVLFIATRCPISNDYNERMKSIYADYSSKGVKFVFINSNNTEPPEEVQQHAREHGFQFTVYKDPGNVVADLFGAQFTPEAYLIKGDKIVYHGRIDDSRSGPVNDHTLRNALDAVLAGQNPPTPETKAFGCTIKRVKVS